MHLLKYPSDISNVVFVTTFPFVQFMYMCLQMYTTVYKYVIYIILDDEDV